jgi:hypothetical protein
MLKRSTGPEIEAARHLRARPTAVPTQVSNPARAVTSRPEAKVQRWYVMAVARGPRPTFSLAAARL